MGKLKLAAQGVMLGAIFGAALIAGPALAAESADQFPSKPIRIIGQGAGSTADYLSRYIGQRLTEVWKQSVVVDNRAGAGGTLSADVVAKTTPDGYSLVMGHAGPMVSAVSSTERFAGAPDISSATEAGIPGMVAELWFVYDGEDTETHRDEAA